MDFESAFNFDSVFEGTDHVKGDEIYISDTDDDNISEDYGITIKDECIDEIDNTNVEDERKESYGVVTTGLYDILEEEEDSNALKPEENDDINNGVQDEYSSVKSEEDHDDDEFMEVTEDEYYAVKSEDDEEFMEDLDTNSIKEEPSNDVAVKKEPTEMTEELTSISDTECDNCDVKTEDASLFTQGLRFIF